MVDASYAIILCGDCSFGPPCRCSPDYTTIERVWLNGRWVVVAKCEPDRKEGT